MIEPIHFDNEDQSNTHREITSRTEPQSMRTFTPSQAVLARSAGCFHWTPEGRRLFDYTSGVLVANLGHNPRAWWQALSRELGWDAGLFEKGGRYFEASTLSAYNAITPVETRATEALLENLRQSRFGTNLEMVCWAASGSEAVQKALWACLNRDPGRDLILATRFGFHGKKGLAGAVTGSEKDADRDPRVVFIGFPMEEVADNASEPADWDPAPYHNELDALWKKHGERIGCLITEPYLGGGGSYHPPKEYLQLLQRFCEQHEILFILDEVQSNFGRTGKMYAFESYEIAPDFVCLGKGLGNGIPVSAFAGRADVMELMKYGSASDTWSGAPIAAAAVTATLEEFQRLNVLDHAAIISEKMRAGLVRLKETGLVTHVRGEGMVFGLECAPLGNQSAEQVAKAFVEACYLGEPGGDGIHLLGPLAGKVIRISPPLTMTETETDESLELLYHIAAAQAERHGTLAATAG